MIIDSVADIGELAISFTNLTSITTTKIITSIGRMSFAFNPNLMSITIPVDIPPTLGIQAFILNYANFKISIPSGGVDAYKSAGDWIDVTEKIIAIE